MIGSFFRSCRSWLVDALHDVEAEADVYRRSPSGQSLDIKTITVLTTAAVCLTVQNYTQHPERIIPLVRWLGHFFSATDLSDLLIIRLTAWDDEPLTRLTWWAIAVSLTYTILPLAVIHWGFREPLSAYGLKRRGMFRGLSLYLLFLSIMVPLIFLVSADHGFQNTYPFLPVRKPSELSSELFRWELLYALQFVSLEFFFRGFILHGVRHRFGLYSIFVMMLPYCMIHFQKPFLECVASILAGIGLGAMSLATRSIWLGAFLHISVAWGMDFACLWRRGLFARKNSTTGFILEETFRGQPLPPFCAECLF